MFWGLSYLAESWKDPGCCRARGHLSFSLAMGSNWKKVLFKFGSSSTEFLAKLPIVVWRIGMVPSMILLIDGCQGRHASGSVTPRKQISNATHLKILIISFSWLFKRIRNNYLHSTPASRNLTVETSKSYRYKRTFGFCSSHHFLVSSI